jgi:uncharacterized membrane protein HdeD (DUF308 family)
MMLDQLIRHWWVLALRGVVAILFAVIAFSQPGAALVALVWVWGAYAFVDGVFAVTAAVRAGERQQRWGMLLLEGVTGIAAGMIAFAWAGIAVLALAYLIAAWAIVTGIFEIAAAVRLREMIEGEWLLGLSGVLSILLGVLFAAMPGAAAVAWVWLIGLYALLFGMLLLALAFRLRALGHGSASRRATT